jgi:hypothetical protein
MANYGEEFQRQFYASQDKYVYFLLAAAASAIALTMQQTSTSALTFWQIPLGSAIVCWGSRFVLGCLNRNKHLETLMLSNDCHLVEEGTHPLVVGRNVNLKEVSIAMREQLAKDSKSLRKTFDYQLYFLLAGATCYLVWHILEMWHRTAQPSS